MRLLLVLFAALMIVTPCAAQSAPATVPSSPEVSPTAPTSPATVSAEPPTTAPAPAAPIAPAAPPAPVVPAAPIAVVPAAPSAPAPAEPVAAPAAPANPNDAVVTLGTKGFNAQSQDGRFAFNLRFPFMFDAKATLNNNLPNLGDAFYPRFFGPIISATLYKAVTGKLIVGFQDKSVTVVNAWLDVAAHNFLHLKVGKVLAPIALERQTLPLRIVFLEHGIASSLLPISEFGAQLWGAAEDKLLEYQLTLSNGAVANQHSEVDLDNEKDLTARAFLRPFSRSGLPLLAGLGLGFGGSYGIHRGTAATPLTGNAKTLGGRTFFATKVDAADPTATTVANGRVYRLVPQAAYVAGPLSVYAEYIRATERLSTAGATEVLTHVSYHVVASLLLTGDKAVLLDIASPKRPFDLSAGTLGAFEVIGRFENIDFDEKTFPTFANPATSARGATAIGGGLNWIPTDLVRLMIDYEHTQFRAAAGAKKLRAENVVGVRLQALF